MEEGQLETKNIFSSGSVLWAVPGNEICQICAKGLAYPMVACFTSSQKIPWEEEGPQFPNRKRWHSERKH